MMRILHVVPAGTRRGAEVFASDLVGALREAGVTQRLAVLRASTDAAGRYAAPMSFLDGGRGWIPGLRVGLGAVRALRNLIKRWRPDVVQAHGGEALKYCVVASVGYDVPIIYRRIGSAYPWLSTHLRRRAYAQLMKRATLIVAVADAVRDETVTLLALPPSRVVAIPNAVDVRRLSPTRTRQETRRALGIPPDAPVMLSLGALSWDKDPLAQVQLASIVLPRHPSVVHVLVGEGPLKSEVESSVRDRELSSRFLVLGPRDDVPDLLAASDVLLLTSRTEGMPGVVIEAGMSGLPVVAYNIGGVPEVVNNGETGLLAPLGDLETLTACILQLLENPNERLAMGAAARDRCRSKFDIRMVAPRYLELYEKAAAGNLVSSPLNGGWP